MTARSIRSQVDVALDPASAFDVFTSEIDLWWLRGPINNWDSARVREMRCEPGVGGRLLEIYDEASDDALELARITVWQPGERLAWDSSVDDVRIDVRFEPTATGTRVSVVASVPRGGKDTGGTSFVRVTPAWFGRWCARRDSVPRAMQDTDRLAIAVHYAKPREAARWLSDAFGLEPVLELPASGGTGDDWVEFRVGHCSLMVLPLDADRTGPGSPQPPSTHVPWIFVDDLDAHFRSATQRGATIVEGIHQQGYRAYVAADPEGHRWTFAQARPTMRG
jgi:uncharacterized glyoxalase superfamily protein PhnB